MSLTSFLNWLFGNITRVLSWFGDKFDIYVDILNNISAYIITLINPVKQYLLDRLGDVYNQLVKWFTDNYNKLTGWIQSTVTQIYNTINSLSATITGSVTGTINNVIDFINSVSKYAYDLVNSLRTELQSWFTANINSFISYALQPFTPLLRLIDSIDRLLLLISNDIQGKVKYLFDTVVPFMVGFTSNPVGFIFDIISGYIVSVACYYIALAIGTTSSNLDITPPWKKDK